MQGDRFQYANKTVLFVVKPDIIAYAKYGQSPNLPYTNTATHCG